MEIKTAKEILHKYESKKLAGCKYNETSIYEAMKEYAKQFLDYASENVEADYNFIGNRDENSSIEAFVCRGEFDKIKELIK